ncbi:MAG TPA: tetratricopeptide repeat protein [Kofleriaceae bacterium]|jgi:tetratricopeptide (TPR) repeat protein|nr:tetratricopeptide repeat protein [Kofleriaceae bacterium]
MSPLGAADRFDQHLIAGGELLRQGRLVEAARELALALELEPHSAKALALLGLAHFRAGRFAEARPVYERLVAATPGDASYQLNLGLVHLKLGDAEAAITALERSRDLDPSQGRAVNYLGLAYARAGRFAEAYQAFLIAGQADLAREISENLSADERSAIEASIRRPSPPPPPPPRAEPPPPPVKKVVTEPAPVDEPAVVEAPKPAEPVAPPPPPIVVRPDAERAAASQAAAAAAAEADPSESQRFVREALDDDGQPSPHEESKELFITGIVQDDQRGAISRAVAQAGPASGGATGLRVAAGSRPPQPLSEFATARLVRPEDGDHPFEISAGGVLIVRVTDKMFTRTEGVDVTGGHLGYEPAMRRSRGQSREEPFDTDGRPMFSVTGKGHLIAAPLGGQFTAVSLDEDIFYLREDLVFAFEPVLRWENGHVPGSRHRIPMVQFRGTGAIAFRTERPLLAVKLAQDKVLYIDATALAGWIGRVVPRAVTPDSGPTSELFVECSGEGVVLVQEEQAPVRPTPTP